MMRAPGRRSARLLAADGALRRRGRLLCGGRGGDQRGSSAVEVLLLLPVVMLLSIFVLWAGRGGQAALVTDLAAAEAATAAAMHCDRDDGPGCNDFVAEVLSGRPGLDLLCIGGPRAVDGGRLVRQVWLGETSSASLSGDDVGLVGVRFACETDGAVAPLRGLFPTVTFHGQSTEVAIRPNKPRVSITVDDVEEGGVLVFKVEVSATLDRDLRLTYEIDDLTDHTGSPADYTAPPQPYEVTIKVPAREAFIEIPTIDDSLHEAHEEILVRLHPPEAVPTGDVPAVLRSSRAVGTILDNDALVVTVASNGSVQETEPSVFTVHVKSQHDENVGLNVRIDYDTADLGRQLGHARGGASCADAVVPDYETANGGRLVFEPGDTLQELVVVLCADDEPEGEESFNLEWRAVGRERRTGTAEGVIAADVERVSFVKNCADALDGSHHACASEDDGTIKFIVGRSLGFERDVAPPTVTVDYVTEVINSQVVVEHPATMTGTETVNPCDSTPLALESDGDFLSRSGTLTFYPNVTEIEVSVTLVDDELNEHFEALGLRLCNLMTTASAGARIGNDWATGLILDDDDEPRLSVSDATVYEGDTFNQDRRLEFDVTLDKESGKRVTVEFHTEDLTADYTDPLTMPPTEFAPATVIDDYSPKNNEEVIIEPGSTDATVTVQVTEDRLIEFEDLDDAAIDVRKELLALKLMAFNARLNSTNDSSPCKIGVEDDDCAVGTIIEDDHPDSDLDDDGKKDHDDSEGIEDGEDLGIPDGETYRLWVTDILAVEGEPLKFEIEMRNSRGYLRNLDQDFEMSYYTEDMPTNYDYKQRFVTSGGQPYVGWLTRKNTWKFIGGDSDYSLSDPYGNLLWVPQSTLATADIDYVSLHAQTAVWPAGQKTLIIQVDSVDDDFDEHYQEFALRLVVPDVFDMSSSQDCGARDSGDDCAVGMIQDDDRLANLTIDPTYVLEGREATITARLVDRYSHLARPSEKDIVSAYIGASASGNYDHPARGGTVCDAGVDFIELYSPIEFAVGTTIATATLTTCADDRPESNETISVGISGPYVGAVPIYNPDDYDDYESAVLSSRSVKIMDSSRTQVGIQPAVPVFEDGDPLRFDVWVYPRLDPGQPSDADIQEVTVSFDVAPYGQDVCSNNNIYCIFAAEPGLDYVDNSGQTLTFDAYTTLRTIEVEIIDDFTPESPEALRVRLKDPVNAVLVAAQSDGIILDNDCWDSRIGTGPPPVEIQVSDGPETRSHNVSVRLVSMPCDASEYRVRAQPVGSTSDADLDTLWRGHFSTRAFEPGFTGAFVTGSWTEGSAIWVDFKVPITDDVIAEGDEPYEIVLEWISPPSYHGTTVVSDIAYIVDDDISQISVDDVAGIEGDAVDFTVSLSSPNIEPVSVEYWTVPASSGSQTATMGSAGSGCDGVDFIENGIETGPKTLTFLPGETSGTVTVQLCGDNTADSGESFLLMLQATAGMPAVIVDHAGQGMILDLVCVDPTNPNHPAPIISVPDVTVAEDDPYEYMATSLSVPFCSQQLGALDYTVDFVDVDEDDFPAALRPLAGKLRQMDLDGNTAVHYTALDHAADTDIEPAESYTWTVNWSGQMKLDYPRYAGLPDAVATIEVLDDDTDAGPVVTLSQRPTSAVEGNFVNFVIELDEMAVGSEVLVEYRTAPDDSSAAAPATSGSDYDPLDSGSQPLSIPIGAVAASLEVQTHADLIDEQNETFRLEITGVRNATLSTVAPDHAVGTILEPCVDPADSSTPVPFTPELVRWSEGEPDGEVEFTFRVEHLLCRDGTVEFDVGGGNSTATAGSDFVPTSGFAPVPALKRYFTVSMRLVDDALFEEDETVDVRVGWLSPASWHNLGAVIATGTIVDDDPESPVPVLSIDDATAVEGDMLDFTVWLAAASAEPVSVAVTTKGLSAGDVATPGADYVPWSGILSFAAGETAKTVSIRTVHDNEIEPHESLQVELEADLQSVAVTFQDPFARGVIEDDDCVDVASVGAGVDPPALVFRARDSQGVELGVAREGDELRFEVEVERRMCEAVYFQAELRPGDGNVPGEAGASDYFSNPLLPDGRLDSVIILPGGTGRFVLEANSDGLIELDETLAVEVYWHPDRMPSSFYDREDGPVYSTGATILDVTAAPTITAVNPQVREGEEAVFKITVSALGDRIVSVGYTTRDDSAVAAGGPGQQGDYVAVQGTLVFRPGDDLTKEVRVRTVPDTRAENAEYFELVLRNPVNATLGGVVIAGEMIVTAKIDDLTNARRPTAVSVTPAPRALEVGWTPPATSGVTRYLVKAVPAPGELFQDAGEVSAGASARSATVTGLIAGVKYHVTVEAKYSNEDVPSAAEPGIPGALSSAPGAPAGASFTVDPNGRHAARSRPSDLVAVQVSWTAPAPADEVLLTELQWRMEGAAFTESNRVVLDANPALIKSFELGAVYDLRMRHWSADGPGDWAEKPGLLVAFVPDSPQPRAAIPHAGSIEVKWRAPAFDGGSFVTGYYVEHRLDGSAGPWTSQTIAVGTNTLTITGLTNGAAYELQVLARNAVGVSDASAPLSAAPGSVPSEPQNVEVVGYTEGSGSTDGVLSVGWDLPSSDGGFNISEYRVQIRRVQPLTGWSSGTGAVDSVQRTALITGLVAGQEYEVRVRAVNESGFTDGGGAAGVGPWSTPVSATTAGVPSAPREVSVEQTGDGLRVSWRRPRSGLATKYQVWHQIATSRTWNDAGFSEDLTLSFALAVSIGDHYKVKVRAVNENSITVLHGLEGAGPWSSEVSLWVATAPDAPPNVRVRSDNLELDVLWDAPGDGGSPITEYVVRYRADSSGSWTVVPNAAVNFEDRTATITGLTNGTEHQVQVRAVNGSVVNLHGRPGGGPWSASVMQTPAVPARLEAPTVVVVEPTGTRKLDVSWNVPGNSEDVDPILEYQVEWRGVHEGHYDFYDRTHRRITTTTERTVIEELPRMVGSQVMEYDVRVRAVNDDGPGLWSSEVSGKPATPVDPVQNFTVQRQGAGAVLLTWDAPVSDNGLPITGYRIRWVKGRPGYFPIWRAAVKENVGAAQRTYLIEHLDTDQTAHYFIAVQPVTGAREPLRDWVDQNYARVESIDMFVPASVPGVPSVSVVAGDAQLTVEWESGATADVPVDSSVVQWSADGGTVWTEVSIDHRYGTAYTIAGLTNDAPYEVQVAGSNSVGSGGWSTTATGTPTSVGGTPALTTKGWHNRLRLSWSWTTNAAFPIDGFVVRWRPATSSTFDPADEVTLLASAREHTVIAFRAQDYRNRDIYIVEVTAVNGNTRHGTATAAVQLYPAIDFLEQEFLPGYDTAHPWLRHVHERSELEIIVSDLTSSPGYLPLSLKGDPWSLPNPLGLIVKRDRWDAFAANPNSTLASGTVIHELAHALTLDPDNMTDALAVLWLYHYTWINGGQYCKVHEVLADTISFNVQSNSGSAYYNQCFGSGSSPTQEAADITASALAGNIDQWFYDKYGLVGSTDMAQIRMEELWRDLTDPSFVAGEDGERDVHRQLAATPGYAFGSFFGGYCSLEEAFESFDLRLNDDPADHHNVTTNPWRDGGCESRQPTGVSTSGDSDSLTVTWTAPIWTSEPDVDGYLVQWKGLGESYDDERQLVVNGLSNLSETITGLAAATDFTVRVAAVDVAKPGSLRDQFDNKRYVEVAAQTSG